mgnify:CR=1 FL=1
MPDFRFEEEEDPNDEAIEIIRENAGEKTVVTINTGDIAHMGGSVRCLSWQLYADDITALGLKDLSFQV